MEVNSLKSVVEAAIKRASAATGVDFTFLMGAAKRESGYNPAAKASSSSAAGLFQFTEQTWLATLKQSGAKYGYARYSDLIEKGSDGRYRVGNADARKVVMDLRLDPHAASMMAGELTSGNAAYIRGRVGRDPTSGELYAAHFLGPQGSARLIQAVNATPQASAASIFPDAAQANPSIFYRSGRAATVRELYANLTATGGSTTPEFTSPKSEKRFIEYASGRNLDRIQQQKELVDLVLRGSLDPDGMGDSGSGSSLSSSVFGAAMLRAAAYANRKAQ